MTNPSHPTLAIRNRASLVVGLLLLLLPLAAWVEYAAPDVWQDRLAVPNLTTEPDRHTPHHTTGTYLPPRLTHNTTYTRSESPLILTTTTHIPANVTVTLEPGVTLVAHEFGALEIAGRFIAAGISNQPILFTTNEEHPANQLWSGIIFQPGSTGHLTHTTIEYASPAVSCLRNTGVTLDTIHIRVTNTGLYTESNDCIIRNSRIQSIGHGLVAVGIDPQQINTTISAALEPIQKINSPK